MGDIQEKIGARERLLRAAISLIGEHGPERITHRMVAEEAGLSPGTATYHFKSLKDLTQQAFLLYIEDYGKALDAVLEARPLETNADIAQFLSRMTMLEADDSELARFEYEMILHSCRHTEIKEDVSAWSRMVEKRVVEALRRLGCEKAPYFASLAVSVCRGTELDLLSKHRNVTEEWMRSRIIKILSLAT